MAFVSNRPYTFGDVMTLDEDDMHEFKSHRTLCIEEIPTWCTEKVDNRLKRTRQSISKTICAFLNTGKGGKIYLGIDDGGSVKGIRMTVYQRDHFLASLYDLRQRFTPPIPSGMISVSVVPVVDPGIKKKTYEEIDFYGSTDEFTRYNKEHSIRTSDFCWCDKDAKAKHDFGLLVPKFVLELEVAPWSPTQKELDEMPRTKLNPIYENEEGLCYIRRQASNAQVTIQDLYEMTKNQVHNFWINDPEYQRKKAEMKHSKGGDLLESARPSPFSNSEQLESYLKAEIRYLRRRKLIPRRNRDGESSGVGTSVSSPRSSDSDGESGNLLEKSSSKENPDKHPSQKPQFSFKEVQLICERLLKARLRTDNEGILNTKLSGPSDKELVKKSNQTSSEKEEVILKE